MVIMLLYAEMFSKLSACNVCVFVFCCAAPNSDIIFGIMEVTKWKKTISSAGSKRLWGDEEGMHWRSVPGCYSYFYSYKNNIHFYFHKNNLRTLREQNLEGGGGACPWTFIVFRVFPLKQFLCMVLRPRRLFYELLNLNLCDHTYYDTLIMQYY